MDGEQAAIGTLRASGRTGMAIFAACCAERLRPLLHHVPSGAPPLVAGVALTELWRILEGQQRVDPRRMKELSEACWTLVEIEPVPKVRTEHLEILVAAAHDALETYLSGNPEHAVAAAKKCATLADKDEPARQDRDLAEVGKARQGLAQLATSMRKRAEAEGETVVRALIGDEG
jgi:hypothetical protein